MTPAAATAPGKTIPGWEYQFIAALGHLRTAWAALVDVERTTPAARTAQTARQVKNLLRRLPAATMRGRRAAGHHGRRVQRRRADRRPGRPGRAPADPPGQRQRVLRQPGHLARQDRPPRQARHGPSPATTTPARPTPNQTSPSCCRTPRSTAPSASTPGARSNPSSTATADGSQTTATATCPSCAVPCCASGSITCPTAAAPHKTMWLWHAGPAPLSLGRAVARLPGPLRRRRARLQIRQGHPRPDRRQSPHPPAGRPVGPPGSGRRSASCCSPARSPPTCAAPGKPGPRATAP